jgi:hypothetical protein
VVTINQHGRSVQKSLNKEIAGFTSAPLKWNWKYYNFVGQDSPHKNAIQSESQCCPITENTVLFLPISRGEVTAACRGNALHWLIQDDSGSHCSSYSDLDDLDVRKAGSCFSGEKQQILIQCIDVSF